MNYRYYIKYSIFVIIVIINACGLIYVNPTHIPRQISHTDASVKILEKIESKGLPHLIYRDKDGAAQSAQVDLATYAITKVGDIMTIHRSWIYNPEYSEGKDMFGFLWFLISFFVTIGTIISIYPVVKSFRSDYIDAKHDARNVYITKRSR